MSDTPIGQHPFGSTNQPAGGGFDVPDVKQDDSKAKPVDAPKIEEPAK